MAAKVEGEKEKISGEENVFVDAIFALATALNTLSASIEKFSETLEPEIVEEPDDSGPKYLS